MNLFNILAEIEKVDPEMMDRLGHRRSALSALGSLSKKLALAAAPLAIGSAFNKAMAQGPGSSVNDILNYALLLERLEYDFYRQALLAPTLTAGFTANSSLQSSITKIRDNENAHVQLLMAALGTNAAPAPRSFDFGGSFASMPTFLTVAQAFEDLGVRAYKGQAGNIPRTTMAPVPNVGTVNVLEVALQIHSVEARHAGYIRYIRRQAALGGQNQFAWITLDQANGAPAGVYGAGTAGFPAESNTRQGPANTDLTGLAVATGQMAYTAAEISEAFDEPLDSATVRSLAGPYIRP